jgi:protein-S-isoprenylcysteine O-methyltransferase Ste14
VKDVKKVEILWSIFESIAGILLYSFMAFDYFNSAMFNLKVQNLDFFAMYFILLFYPLSGIIWFFLREKENKGEVYWPSRIFAFLVRFSPILLTSPFMTKTITPKAAYITSLGALIVIASIWNLNFSYGWVPANRGVKTEGLYKIVRHPMYLGHSIMLTGWLLLYGSLFNLIVYTIFILINITLIFLEEQVLVKDEKYRKYCKNVRYRLIPYIF